VNGRLGVSGDASSFAGEIMSSSSAQMGVMSASLKPIAAALARLARGAPTDLSALLHDVERHVVLEGTNVVAHCHCLTLDGNGRPRIESLVEAVAEHVLDYAIPRTLRPATPNAVTLSGARCLLEA
jgi:hypothetical protein